MKRKLLSSTVAAITLFSTTHILAADYDQGVVTHAPAETYTDVEFGSGWYIRGDLTFNSRGKSENTVSPIGSEEDPFNLQADYDDVIGFRAGIGYQYSPYLRFDATAAGTMKGTLDGVRSQAFGGSRQIDFVAHETVNTVNDAGETVPTVVSTELTETVYFNSNGDVTGTTHGNYSGSKITPVYGSDEVDADYTVSNFIVNGYVDIPISDKIVPYVGGGAGFARVNYHETRKLTCNPDSASACRYPAGDFGEATEVILKRDEEYWAFAYQLTAGAAIRLTDRTSIDLGYTYLNVDGGDDLAYENGLAIDDDGFAIHQGHVGIRYEIN